MTTGLEARLHLRITGRVQGVFYRATTQRVARQLNLVGWVRNCPDGSVELVAEGRRSACETLLESCRGGPPEAAVAAIEATWSAPAGEFVDFEARY